MKTFLLLTAATLLLSALVASSASALLGDLSVVSRADGPAGLVGDEQSYANARSTSADGRYVVFISHATTFGGALTAARSIYRRDTLLGRTELVSRANGLAGAPADDASFSAAVSADGNKVAFASGADNLSADDNNSYTNIFLRDVAAGTTTLISRASNGGAANQSSLAARISGDGAFVAFGSSASNLDATVVDNNGFGDAFVRDVAAGVTRLVSKTTGGTIGNALSGPGDISFDGRYVTVDSEANNLGGVTGGNAQVYLRDRALGTTTLLSQPTGTGNTGGNDSSSSSTITDSGDAVAFISRASDLVAGTPPNRYLGFVRNVATNTTSIATRSSSGEVAASDVGEPMIAVDGSGVAYSSAATNLDGPAGTGEQTFFTDLTTGQTQLVSRVGRDGPAANADATDATLGRTRNFVLFTSDASNLVADATNGKRQLFMRDVRAVDPISTVGLSGKRFTARLSRSRFAVKVNTANGPTAISGSATIRVSKRITRSGKVVVRYRLRALSAASSSHKLTFKLSKRQNRLVRRALKTKRTRLRVSVSLTASKTGSQASARISGKLRR